MLSGIVFDIKRYAIHDGPGIRTSVFLKGCPLECRWCHNPEGIACGIEILYRKDRCGHSDDCLKACPEDAIIKNGSIKQFDLEKCTLCGDCIDICNTGALEFAGREMNVGEVMDVIERDTIFYDESGGGVTFSGGEPLSQVDFLYELLHQCKTRDIHTAVDTSGYCAYSALERIEELVDLFLYDIKVVDDRIHKKYTGVSNQIILENMEKLFSNGRKTIVRIPLIPGVNDTQSQVAEAAAFFLNLGTVKEIDLLPYHKWGVAKFSRLSGTHFSIEDFPGTDSNLQYIKNSFENHGFSVNIGG